MFLHLGEYLDYVKPVLLRKYIMIRILERGMSMALVEAVKTVEPTYTIDDSMNVLLGKLDEAIDDMENGRVQTIDEAWKEIDEV